MGGWGWGYAARLFLLFSFPCSADHERDWPPCKVVFFGLATNTLNVRNNNNNIVLHVQNLRTCLQIRTTKAERFAVEIDHFKIQHAEYITGYG